MSYADDASKRVYVKSGHGVPTVRPADSDIRLGRILDNLDGMARHHTIEQIEDALRANGGQIPLAARQLGLVRQAVYDRVRRSMRLQNVLTEIQEDLKGDAQCAIAAAIRSGDMPTVRWFAERKMRDEGYGTKIETPVDTAQLERIVEAIAKHGGIPALRAVRAAIAGAGGWPP